MSGHLRAFSIWQLLVIVFIAIATTATWMLHLHAQADDFAFPSLGTLVPCLVSCMPRHAGCEKLWRTTTTWRGYRAE
ncbi:MAG: hypothetical protein ACHQ50_04315 [Fimbriimonadales bacterium]